MCWYIFVPFSVYFEQSEITETESNNGTEITDVTEVEDDLLEGENDNDLDNEDQDRKPPLRYVCLGNNGTEITDVTEIKDDLLEGENDNDLDNEDQDRKPPLRYVCPMSIEK